MYKYICVYHHHQCRQGLSSIKPKMTYRKLDSWQQMQMDSFIKIQTSAIRSHTWLNINRWRWWTHSVLIILKNANAIYSMIHLHQFCATLLWGSYIISSKLLHLIYSPIYFRVTTLPKFIAEAFLKDMDKISQYFITPKHKILNMCYFLCCNYHCAITTILSLWICILLKQFILIEIIASYTKN